ncbi:TIGR04219 family outer membrane beta-barrel protein [Marinicella sediminis]|uniref:TIGR04219 family outer membrane beta-barrel protein n=1 Tax=Marinicella sediminis TaxID=1792834 RepID=A0ABV7JAZ2_9GAMM|nr:TIGR04219 family outer membrane beta-barrel protein [Marinicella sediminis]
MKKLTWLFIWGCLLHNWSVVSADTILGFYAGASHWQHDLSDDINSELPQKDCSETGRVVYFALEHPIPVLPNFKIRHNNIKGERRESIEIADFGGALLQNEFSSTADLSHTEIMLYYEVLDNWVNLDLGMAVKQFNGSIRLNHTSEFIRNELDDVVPMLYGKGQIDLPFTGLSAFGSIEALSMGNDEVTDIELGLNYEGRSGLGGVLGYRTMNTDLDHSGFNADFTVKGFFLGLNYHF